MKNTNIVRNLAVATFAIALLAISPTFSVAQSGHNMTGQQKAGQRQTEIGLEGYCPVCVIKHGKWVKGKAEHSATFDGVTYYFPGANVKEMFQQNPAAYVPALGGDCIVCYAKAGKRVSGDIRFASLHNDRLFLFPSDKERQMFNQSPQQFEDEDIAADGNCIVCSVKAGKTVPGSTKFTAVHDGFRYLFPSNRERQLFAASPTEFVAAGSRRMSGSGMQKANTQDVSHQMKKSDSTIQVQGITACAACEFGVTPINAPQELGLAVTTTDGQVYVIEDGHTRWPQLYKDRFDGKRVAVTGSVLKTEGNISWVNPSDLQAY